jgi:hypothetical protein
VFFRPKEFILQGVVMPLSVRGLMLAWLVGMGALLILMQPTASARAEAWKIPVSTILNPTGH